MAHSGLRNKTTGVNMKDLLITPAKAMVALCCGAAMLQSRGVVVSTGSVVESGSGVASVEIMATERLGNLAVEFQKDWRFDPPAASGVRRLYSRILDQAVTATDVWPKVECSDRVRYSVYPDGTIYVLNTENSLRSEVIVRRSENTPPERILLAPGELKHLQFCVKENQ